MDLLGGRSRSTASSNIPAVSVRTEMLVTNEPAREERVSQTAMCRTSVKSSEPPAGTVAVLSDVIVNRRISGRLSSSPRTRTGSRPSLPIRHL